MTQQAESVVTPERFGSGMTYEQWMQKIDRNQKRFEENYEEMTISEDDARALRALVEKPNGPAKCLALGEAWCPDVFRGLPVMARIAEASTNRSPCSSSTTATTTTSPTGLSGRRRRTRRCRSCES